MVEDKRESDEEFERFEELTRRLLAVSKNDLDTTRKANNDAPQNGERKAGPID